MNDGTIAVCSLVWGTFFSPSQHQRGRVTPPSVCNKKTMLIILTSHRTGALILDAVHRPYLTFLPAQEEKKRAIVLIESGQSSAFSVQDVSWGQRGVSIRRPKRPLSWVVVVLLLHNVKYTNMLSS